MRVKTSITLDTELLNRVDTVLRANESRSAFFADAARRLVQKRERAARDKRDIDILNVNAKALNEEALEDVAFVADIFRASDLEDIP